MTVHHLSYVLEFSEAEHSDRLVLIALANHANEEHVAYPGVERIAREARLGDSTVRAALLRLWQAGEIELLDGLSRYKTRRYRLPDPFAAHRQNLAAPELSTARIEHSDRQNLARRPPDSAGEPSTKPSEEPSSLEGVQGELLPSPVSEVWEHYQQVVPNAERRKLDARRRRCIRRALDVRSVEQCKAAITALSRSSFHLGQNDRHTSYLDIEYALGRRSDSPDATIDRWLERSGGATGQLSPVEAKMLRLGERDRRRVADLMREARRGLFGSSQHQPVIEAGRRALAELRRLGFDVVTNPDGSFAGWKVIE